MKKVNKVLESSKMQAAIERERVLAQGGNAALIWRSAGIRAATFADRKKTSNKNACRGSFR